jgi:hypothetical protein
VQKKRKGEKKLDIYSSHDILMKVILKKVLRGGDKARLGGAQSLLIARKLHIKIKFYYIFLFYEIY